MRIYRNWPVVVASAFLKHKEKYLLVFDPRFDVWRVPGGKVLRDESPETTLKRELKEELNLNIDTKKLKFLGFGHDTLVFKSSNMEVSGIVLYFEYMLREEDVKVMCVKSKKEIAEIKWVNIEALIGHKNLEGALQNFFERFGERYFL